MNIANISAGRYVVAVSGGVDSVVLLHVLASMPGMELIVAHFDHGIRRDSREDAQFVATLADQYGLEFVSEREDLGPHCSEDQARRARYAFLQAVCQKRSAQAVVTAHHQDDLLETAIINITRGTGWRGICSLRDTPMLRRPLLGAPKEDIVAYAKAHRLKWREDPTNTDSRYLRNKIRSQVIPRLTGGQRQEFLALIARQGELRQEVEANIDLMINGQAARNELPRSWLIMLPNIVAMEVLSEVVCRLSQRRVEQKMLSRMLWFAKTASLYKTLQVSRKINLYIQKSTVVVRVK